MTQFNPQDHMMKLQGKDYLPVAPRVLWARQEHPDWSITTDVVEIGGGDYMRATITTEAGHILATAHKRIGGGRQGPASSYPVEAAETGAIGRALALCGYGTLGSELDEGQDIADSPVTPPAKGQRAAPAGKAANGAPVDPATAKPGTIAPAEVDRLIGLATTEAEIDALRPHVEFFAKGQHGPTLTKAMGERVVTLAAVAP